eukprot:7010661-Prorocentrum_lima.AAC.1
MEQKGRVHGTRGSLNSIMTVMLHNVPHQSLRHGSSHRGIVNKSLAGTYPAEVIKDNDASRGRA